MKSKFLNIFIFIFLVFSLVGCAGEQGPVGPQGEQGIQGAQGEQGQPGKDGVDGQDGVDGKDGTSLLTGNGEPTNVIGIVGDSYIDLDTWSFYIKTTNGWVISGNIKGEKGESSVIEYDGTEGLDFYPINDEKCGVSVGRAFLQENIVIPSLYNGRKVTQIIYEGFAGCSNLTSITLPETLETLDADAFNYCSNLENVYYKGTIDKWCSITANEAGFESSPMCYADNFYMLDENKEWYCVDELIIPDNVETINFGVFSNFNNITDLTLPSSVKTIGAYAFEYCSSLENIYYDGTFEDWCNISFEEFGWGSPSNPMRYADNIYFLDDNGNIEHNGKRYSMLKEVIIPNTISEIGAYQFYNFSSLENIVIPNTVLSIGENAFYGCENIKKMEIPFVGEKADESGSTYFVYLFGNSSSTSYNGVPSSLKEVKVTGGTNLGSSAFYYCKNIEKIILPDTLISIGEDAFCGCSSLTSINLPSSITSIGKQAFYGCSSLTSIVIPEGVTSIGDSAFSGCSSLTIYCNVSIKPSSWGTSWNSSKPVYWAGEWEYDDNGNPVPLS